MTSHLAATIAVSLLTIDVNGSTLGFFMNTCALVNKGLKRPDYTGTTYVYQDVQGPVIEILKNI
jgi:hypothetical protein